MKKFRVPGAELREALRPVPLLSASIQLTDNLSLEGFYQFKHEEMEIDPAGSYFSTKDFVGDGGQYAMLGFGSLSNPNMSSRIDNPLASILHSWPGGLTTSLKAIEQMLSCNMQIFSPLLLIWLEAIPRLIHMTEEALKPHF